MPINFTVETDVAHGPLDLVLELVESRTLLVNELSLAKITDDFIACVRAQDTFPVEETVHFLSVAATLLLLKSKSLVPDLALSEEEETGVQEFTHRLQVYESVRSAARLLMKHQDSYLLAGGTRVSPPTSCVPGDLSLEKLVHTMRELVARLPQKENLPEHRITPVISIDDMMVRLSKRVQSALSLPFHSCVGKGERQDIIVSFLALLELIRQGTVHAEQEDSRGEILLRHAAPSTTPHYA